MILVLNCGSQSIKYKIFDKELKEYERFEIEVKNQKEYREKLEKIFKNIDKDIDLIGHRVVHGGNYFFEPVKINDNILKKLREISYLAPLHNPFNILGIEISRKIFKNIDNYAVFDTGFFKDLPEVSKIYPLPEYIIKRFKIQRFGFHGLSYEYVLEKTSEILKKPKGRLNLISCHLGGGGSICAIKNGKPIDISMGYTPLEGIMMMTRSGDIDPGIVILLAKNYGYDKAYEILNKESGMVALSKKSSMLEIIENMKKGDKNCKLAFDLYVYRIKKYIGGYYAILGRIDALVFTGKIGAGKRETRDAICKNLNFLKDVKVLSIKTDEEYLIAKKISRYLK
ncbi:MAG: acetate/propionate family kinase [Minisyncoccia bacterium]